MVATMDAVKHIVSKGYKKILFICPPLEMKEVKNTYTHSRENKDLKMLWGCHQM